MISKQTPTAVSKADFEKEKKQAKDDLKKSHTRG